MDAHSVSYTSAAERSTSRIYRDLNLYYRITIAQLLDNDDMSTATSVMAGIGKRRAQILRRVPRIGIVGAGLAGLRCADILLQNGFEVTVIEARGRIGGRVRQVSLAPGHLVDAGPNWIHGTDNNPIMDLAEKTSTGTGSWDAQPCVIDETGHKLSDADIYSNLLWDIIKDAFAHSNKNTGTISSHESFLGFFHKEVARRIPDNSLEAQRKREIMYQMAETWGAYVGIHAFRQSLKYFWLEECIDGENLFCPGTYAKILAAISEPVIKGAILRTHTLVTKVQSTDDETCGMLQVHTENGETLEFDEVVFTAPLGWLKKHPDTFQPPLPTRLAQAIENIGYGCLEKVYISFPKAFWRLPGSKDDTQGFILFLSPNYAPDSNPGRWNQEIVELSSFQPSDSHPTLLFYTYGEQSKFITSEVAKCASRREKDAFLYDWFRPYYSRLPRFDENSPDCQPVFCYSTEWLLDDLAGNGSYSNFQVGLEEGDKDIEVMREGLPERGLWLAGEHTAPFVALGTVTGAYWSGEAVGKRIIQEYGNQQFVKRQ